MTELKAINAPVAGLRAKPEIGNKKQQQLIPAYCSNAQNKFLVNFTLKVVSIELISLQQVGQAIAHHIIQLFAMPALMHLQFLYQLGRVRAH